MRIVLSNSGLTLIIFVVFGFSPEDGAQALTYAKPSPADVCFLMAGIELGPSQCQENTLPLSGSSLAVLFITSDRFVYCLVLLI